jgi:hypothetical protein
MAMDRGIGQAGHGYLSAHDATEMAANLAFRRPIRAEEEFDAFLFQHPQTLS